MNNDQKKILAYRIGWLNDAIERLSAELEEMQNRKVMMSELYDLEMTWLMGDAARCGFQTELELLQKLEGLDEL